MMFRQAYIICLCNYIWNVLKAYFVSLREYIETLRGMPKMSVKVMVAFGPQTYTLLEAEAKERGVSIQELLRAVIIPEWFRTRVETIVRNAPPTNNNRPGDIHGNLTPSNRHRVLS